MAGFRRERQETALILTINLAIAAANVPITICAGDVAVMNVCAVEKCTTRTESGKESYTDVLVHRAGDTTLRWSLKGESAPSLAGGGLRGMEAVAPGLMRSLMIATVTHAQKLGHVIGDKLPDFYSPIPSDLVLRLIQGDVCIGGPLDHLYIGGMTPTWTFDDRVLTFTNGTLLTPATFAQSRPLWFRVRRRRADQPFDPISVDALGIPRVYGRSPRKKDIGGRVVIVPSVPENAQMLPLNMSVYEDVSTVYDGRGLS